MLNLSSCFYLCIRLVHVKYLSYSLENTNVFPWVSGEDFLSSAKKMENSIRPSCWNRSQWKIWRMYVVHDSVPLDAVNCLAGCAG